MTSYSLLFIYLVFVILAVNARRNIQNRQGSLNSGGSGQNYLRKTESDWQGQWFTGSCKYSCKKVKRSKHIISYTRNISVCIQ